MINEIQTKAFTDGWEKTSFTAKDGKEVNFKQYIATVVINGEYTDYTFEFSWFNKSMKVSIVELQDAGGDWDKPEVITNLIGTNKVTLTAPKDNFIFLLGWAKSELLRSLQNVV